MPQPQTVWWPDAKDIIQAELNRIKATRKISDQLVADYLGGVWDREFIFRIRNGREQPKKGFAKAFAEFASTTGQFASGAGQEPRLPLKPKTKLELLKEQQAREKTIYTALLKAEKQPYEAPDFNDELVANARKLKVSDVDYPPFSGLPQQRKTSSPSETTSAEHNETAGKKEITDTFFHAVFQRRFFDLAGVSVEYLGGRPQSVYGDVSLALFDSLDRMLQFRFWRVPIRIGLGAVCLQKHHHHLMKVARLLSNLDVKHPPKICAIVVSGEVGGIHCQKRLKLGEGQLGEGHEIKECGSVNASSLKEHLEKANAEAGHLIPVVCCDELTALRVLGLLKRDGCSVFPMNSRRAGRDALDHLRRTRRELPQYYCGIAVKRRNRALQDFMQDALVQFLSTEIDTTAASWFRMAEALADEIYTISEFASGGRRRATHDTIAESHSHYEDEDPVSRQKTEGKRWIYTWEWIFYTLSLDSETIDSYSTFDLPWKPILLRARVLLQAYLGAPARRKMIISMAEFLGSEAHERLSGLFEVPFTVPGESLDSPGSEIIADSLQRALRAEQPEFPIDLHIYDPHDSPEAKKGMTAFLHELMTMYSGYGLTDAIEKIGSDIPQLSDLYGKNAGRIVLATAMEHPEGFIGGVCVTNLNKLDGTDACEFRYLWVQPECRTKKVGKRILGQAIKCAQDAECKSVYVEVVETVLDTAFELFDELHFKRSKRPPSAPGRTVLERMLNRIEDYTI